MHCNAKGEKREKRKGKRERERESNGERCSTEDQENPFVSEIAPRRYAFSVEKPVFRRILRMRTREAGERFVPTKILTGGALFDK